MRWRLLALFLVSTTAVASSIKGLGPQSGAASSGYLSSTDWTTFNGKGAGTVTSVTGTAPIVSSGGATPAISISASTAAGVAGSYAPGSQAGYTGGSAIPAGDVGETITHTFAATAATTSTVTFSVDNSNAFSLTAGVWIVFGWGIANIGTGAGITYQQIDINTSAALRGTPTNFEVASATLQGNPSGAIYPLLVNSNGSTRIFGLGNYAFASLGTSTISIQITAVRIN